MKIRLKDAKCVRVYDAIKLHFHSNALKLLDSFNLTRAAMIISFFMHLSLHPKFKRNINSNYIVVNLIVNIFRHA